MQHAELVGDCCGVLCMMQASDEKRERLLRISVCKTRLSISLIACCVLSAVAAAAVVEAPTEQGREEAFLCGIVLMGGRNACPAGDQRSSASIHRGGVARPHNIWNEGETIANASSFQYLRSNRSNLQRLLICAAILVSGFAGISLKVLPLDIIF